MRRDALLILGLCLAGLVLACFGTVLFRDRQFAYRDAAHFYYPLYQRVQQEWAAGRLPLWEPEENGGMPLLGNPTAAVLYPGKLLFAVAPSYPWGVRLYTIAHVLLAVGAMVALARSWGISRAGASLAGLSYGFGAPILFQYCNIVFLVGAAWLPLGLRAVDRWVRLGRRWALGELAVVLALEVLGGDPQVAYLTGLCAAGYAIGLSRVRGRADAPRRPWLGWVLCALAVLSWIGLVLVGAWLFPQWRPERRPPAPLPWMIWVRRSTTVVWALAGLWFVSRLLRRGPRPAWAGTLAGLLGAGLLAGALAGVQMLPVIEFTSQSVRAADQGPHDIYPFSLEPTRLIEAVIPNFYGTAFEGNKSWLPLVPPLHAPDLWVASIYVGALPLVLALSVVGLRSGPAWRGWMTVILFVSLVGAFGKFGSPLWIARQVPGTATWLGRPDRLDDAVIRFDGMLRDGDGSLYWLMATVLPGFKEFRYPSKLLTFTCAALAVLAGLGWDRVMAGQARRALRWTTAGLAVAIVGLLGVLVGRGAILAIFRASTMTRSGSSLGPFEPDAAWRDLAWALGQGGVTLLATLGLLRLARSRRALAAALAPVLLAVDLGLANSGQVLSVPQSDFEARPEVLELIEQAERERPSPGGLYRVHRMPVWDPIDWRQQRDPERFREFVRWERRTLQPKYGIPLGLHYTLTEGTAELYDYVFYFAAFPGIHDPELGRRILGDPKARILYYARRGFDLWNTRYFVLPYVMGNDENRGIRAFLPESTRLAPAEFGNDQEAEKRWGMGQDWQLVRNDAAYPRAWVVHQARFPAPISGLRREDRDGLMQEILYQGDPFRDPLWFVAGKPSYDPKRVAWIETDDRSAFGPYLSGGPFDPTENPRITRYEPQRIELEAELKSPGLIVLAEAFYPGWRLTIDGEPAPIHRTNRVMRGAAVQAGRHTLVFTYQPWSVRVGAMVTLFGCFGLGALALWSFREPVEAAVVEPSSPSVPAGV